MTNANKTTETPIRIVKAVAMRRERLLSPLSESARIMAIKAPARLAMITIKATIMKIFIACIMRRYTS